MITAATAAEAAAAAATEGTATATVYATPICAAAVIVVAVGKTEEVAVQDLINLRLT